jgi:type IV pilus assembly protein PilW
MTSMDRWRTTRRHCGMRRRRRQPLRQSGVTLVDVLVGLVVALLSIIVVHQAFVIIDAVRRSVAAAADAHGAAAFALAALSAQAGNAGAGIAYGGRWLDSCPIVADIASTLRPIAVQISAGTTTDRPDSLIVRQSLAPIAAPATLVADAPAGTPFLAQASGGFQPGDRIVAVSRTGTCIATEITAVAAAAAGILEIGHRPVGADLPSATVLMNLGPSSRGSTTRFDVVGATLRSTDIGNGDAPTPVVSNIVTVKFQYGIDTDGDGTPDRWVAADAASGWSAADILGAPRSKLADIKALRIGVIARSDQPERTRTGAYRWVLFDCGRTDGGDCPGRLEGTIAGSPAGGYRYRALERVVMLPNVLWNRE